ncbi:hypothetical protein [Lentzea indica]|uniref:hypothetical protein n=1 Tax=Lentzea indica TaxID=2604800 RepID=UPI001CB7567F|nr:hypothetical protein [Lentzea indica]
MPSVRLCRAGPVPPLMFGFCKTFGPPWELSPVAPVPPPAIVPAPETLGPPCELRPNPPPVLPGGGLALVLVSKDLRLLLWLASVLTAVWCVALMPDWTSVNALAPFSA